MQWLSVMTTYYVEVYARGRSQWRDEIISAMEREILDLGAQRAVTVEFTDGPADGEPSIGIYLASPEALTDENLQQSLTGSMRKGRVIFPVVQELAVYETAVPAILVPLNGYEWSGASPRGGLVRKVLAELGVEDQSRRAFISHRRADGLAAAEQVHDHLSHLAFDPFIDRFHIAAGRDVQAQIADGLDDCALLILLETPLAHESEWVFDEVEYALSHQLGLLIVTWPGSPTEIPGTRDLPAQASC